MALCLLFLKNPIVLHYTHYDHHSVILAQGPHLINQKSGSLVWPVWDVFMGFSKLEVRYWHVQESTPINSWRLWILSQRPAAKRMFSSQVTLTFILMLKLLRVNKCLCFRLMYKDRKKKSHFKKEKKFNCLFLPFPQSPEERTLVATKDTVLVRLGCYNWVAQTEWLINNRNLFWL